MGFSYSDFDVAYNREIKSHPERRIALMLLLLTLNFVIFGVFGVLGGLVHARKKLAVLSDYSKMQEVIVDNTRKLEGIEPFLENSNEVAFVNAAVPSTLKTEDYIELLTTKAASHQIIVAGFGVDGTAGQKTDLVTGFEFVGPTKNVPLLLADIEEMERFTSIWIIEIAPDIKAEGGVSDVDLVMGLYYLGSPEREGK